MLLRSASLLLVMRHRLMGNVAALAAARLVSIFCQLLVTLAIVRALGAEAFGLYQYAVTCGVLAAVFSGFGQRISVTREVAYDAAAGEAGFRAAMRLQLGLVLVGLGMLAVYAQFEPTEAARGAVMLAGAALALGPFSQLLVARIHGYERMGVAAAGDAAASLVLLVTVMVMLAMGAGPLMLILAWGVRELALCGASWLLSRRYLPPPPAERPPAPPVRETLRRTLPFALMVFLHFLYLRLGLLLVRHLAPTDADLGHYAAAVRVVDGVLLLAGLVGTALYPRLASLHRTDGDGLGRTLEQAHRWLGLLGIPIAVILAAWGPWVAPLLFGQGYGPAAGILALLAVPVLLNFLYWPSAHALNATGSERLWLRALSLMLLSEAAIGLWLVPRFAGVGAALATGLGEAVGLVVVLVYVRRAVPGFRPLQALAPLALPAMVLAAGVLLLGRWQPVVGTVVGLLAYALWLRADLKQMAESLRGAMTQSS